MIFKFQLFQTRVLVLRIVSEGCIVTSKRSTYWEVPKVQFPIIRAEGLTLRILITIPILKDYTKIGTVQAGKGTFSPLSRSEQKMRL
jgi:hypothetical protein